MRTLFFNLTIAILSLFVLTSATVPVADASRENSRGEQVEESRDKGQNAKEAKKTARLEKRYAKAKTQKKRNKLKKKMHKRDGAKGGALGLVALILGGLAFLFSVLIYIVRGPWIWLALLLSIPAVILGAIGMKGENGTLALVGMILGIVAFVAVLFAFIFFLVILGSLI